MENQVIAKRTLTYIGPAEWVRMCAERGFVELRRELGSGKQILSNWQDESLQEVAETTPPEKRRTTVEARINRNLIEAATSLEVWLSSPQDDLMNRRQVEDHRAMLRAAVIQAEAEL